jgi:hypothetical protein
MKRILGAVGIMALILMGAGGEYAQTVTAHVTKVSAAPGKSTGGGPCVAGHYCQDFTDTTVTIGDKVYVLEQINASWNQPLEVGKDYEAVQVSSGQMTLMTPVGKKAKLMKNVFTVISVEERK